MWYNIDNNLREYIQSRLVAPECTIFRCPVINIIIHQSIQDIHRKRVEKTTKKDGKTAKKKRMIIMEKKKGFSLLKTFIAIVCILFIIVSLAVNIAFSAGKTPNIFGKCIYLVEKDFQVTRNDPSKDIKKGEALIAKAITDSDTLLKDDIVLCYPADSPDKLCVRSIQEIIVAADGAETYITAESAQFSDSGSAITRDKITAVCTGHPKSKELGAFLRFTKSIPGIALELLLPCVILVIFLIAKIVSSRNNAEEETDTYDFYEYDEEEKLKEDKKPSHAKSENPLFENFQEIQPSGELERKKMSIVENFSQKKVNPDSPYQKEKERTMQFKAQRSAESTFAAKNVGAASSTAPTADALREEMLRKTAEAERTGNYNIKGTGGSTKPAASASDITGVLPKAQLAEMSRSDVPKTTPLRSQSAQPSAAPKKSSSPDISDIIKKTDTTARKKSAADMSVDDLLKLIEDEKKKL